jgi:hypothetical protein
LQTNIHDVWRSGLAAVWILKTDKENRYADSIFEVEAIEQKSYGSMDLASDLHIIHHA